MFLADPANIEFPQHMMEESSARIPLDVIGLERLRCGVPWGPGTTVVRLDRKKCTINVISGLRSATPEKKKEKAPDVEGHVASAKLSISIITGNRIFMI
jgi:hypothetical protein